MRLFWTSASNRRVFDVARVGTHEKMQIGSCTKSISIVGEGKTMTVQIDVHGQAKSLKRKLNCDLPPAKAYLRLLSTDRRSQVLLRRGEVGSQLVELAVVMPILLALITGICSFGLAFNHELTLTNAVGAGGQYLQLIRTTTTDPCADTFSAIGNAAPGLTAGSISLSFNLNGTTVTGNSCPGDQSYLTSGAPVTVSATYPCSLSIVGSRFSVCQLSAKVTEYEY